MNFDKMIMNPPYNRGLHIKILAEAKNHLTNSGHIVSLQPIVKWQEAELFNKTIPVSEMNVIARYSMDESSALFGINQRCELGILSNKCKSVNIVDNINFLTKIYSKLKTITNVKLCDKLECDYGEFPVGFGYGCTIAGNGGHGCACYRITGYNEEKSCRREKIGHSKHYNARSDIEQHMCWKFYNNIILRFIYKEFGFGGIPYSIIPFVTEFKDKFGKTPFDYEWTCYDMCKFFEISKSEFEIVVNSIKNYLYEDEQKIIEETMAKYK